MVSVSTQLEGEGPTSAETISLLTQFQKKLTGERVQTVIKNAGLYLLLYVYHPQPGIGRSTQRIAGIQLILDC